jgi:DNA-binding NarL/FixJ family response regulator
VSPWKSSVFIPTTTKFVYVLHLQNEISEKSLAEAYFHCLSKLLSLYHYRSNSENRGTNHESEVNISSKPKSMYGKSLTERQSEILALIKSAMTNSMIAERIGYSESLVRRETITIHANLGIRGRKDLFNKAATGSLVELGTAMSKDLKQASG